MKNEIAKPKSKLFKRMLFVDVVAVSLVGIAIGIDHWLVYSGKYMSVSLSIFASLAEAALFHVVLGLLAAQIVYWGWNSRPLDGFPQMLILVIVSLIAMLWFGTQRTQPLIIYFRSWLQFTANHWSYGLAGTTGLLMVAWLSRRILRVRIVELAETTTMSRPVSIRDLLFFQAGLVGVGATYVGLNRLMRVQFGWLNELSGMGGGFLIIISSLWILLWSALLGFLAWRVALNPKMVTLMTTMVFFIASLGIEFCVYRFYFFDNSWITSSEIFISAILFQLAKVSGVLLGARMVFDVYQLSGFKLVCVERGFESTSSVVAQEQSSPYA